MIVVDTSTPSIYSDIETAAVLKKNVPNDFIVMVGVHVSALHVETLDLNSAINAVAYGEYDETLAEIADKLKTGLSDEILSSIAGLAYRASD